MITRTTKYTASDGTEHDSPQAAATHDLQNSLYRLVEQALPEISTDDLVKLTMNLSVHLPEALRDALNTYFEDLETHPDVEIDHMQRAKDIVESWPAWKRNYRLTEHSPDVEVGDPLVCDRGDIESVSIFKDGEWQHFDVSQDGTFTTDLPGTFQLDGDPENPSTWFVVDPEDLEREGRRFSDMLENAKHATVLGASHAMPKDKDRYIEGTLPVDHPQYCRPFGTRED